MDTGELLAGGTTCDGLSHPGRVAVLVVVSCYKRNGLNLTCKPAILSPCINNLSFSFLFTGGGSCFCWSAELLNRGRRGEVTSWELIGPDCEPIYSICRSSNTVYSACRDANIRKYVFRQSELSS